MSEPTRFTRTATGIRAHTLGEYVRYEDYISLRQQLADTQRKLKAALSTEAQPEVTGAVYVLKDKLRVLQHSIDLHVCLHKSPNHNLRPASDFTPLYPPSAIQAAVREKLEEVLQMCIAKKEHAEKTYGVAESVGADMCIRGIRALMESPQSSMEEPAN